MLLSGEIAVEGFRGVERVYGRLRGTRIMRHVCVVGSGMIEKWTGTHLHAFLARIGPGVAVRRAGFACAGGYYEGIDMPTALHPQTPMALRPHDEALPRRHGYLHELCDATKRGFKNPNCLARWFATDDEPLGYEPGRGFNRFSGR